MTLQACAEIVRKGDPDRFLATMAAPPIVREKLFPIFALNVEIARAPWVTEEAMIAEMRLQWWRDALEEIKAGGIVRTHEVVTPLQGVIDQEAIDIMDKSIQSRRWDIYKDPFEDPAHLDEYLDATSGGLLWIAARALGAKDGEDAIRTLGYCSGLANWFLAIPKLEAAGRKPLVDGRPEAIAELAQIALSRLRSVSTIPNGAIYAAHSTWRAKTILKKVAGDPGAVSRGTLAQSEFARRGSLLWRTLFAS